MAHTALVLTIALGGLAACTSDGVITGASDSGNDSTIDGAPQVAADADPNAPDASCEPVEVSPTGNDCPGAPAGAEAEAAAALELSNVRRRAMGIGCQTQVEAINTASSLHCDYYAANSGACTANAHVEVDTCSLYVSAQFSGRMSAAGYTGIPSFENMAFVSNGTAAVNMWIDSVWHRTPVLSPWVGDQGYGRAAGCDTMDFGRGTQAASDLMVVYPYHGQVEVPTSFSGNEGPPPPAPEGGFPSGYPIHLYAKDATVSAHVLRKKCDATALPHVWITPSDSPLLRDEHVMYANEPLAAGTTYVLEFAGTHQGAAFTHSSEFTTR